MFLLPGVMRKHTILYATPQTLGRARSYNLFCLFYQGEIRRRRGLWVVIPIDISSYFGN